FEPLDLLVLAEAERLALEAEIAADAVVGVDDVIADLELPQVLEERPPAGLVALLAVFAAAPARAGPEDLLLRDDGERFGGEDEAGREVADRHLRRAGRPAGEHRGRER